MQRSTVRPNGWIALRLPNENVRVLQAVPNTTINLGKYGAFPCNLILERPFYFTYEVQDKREGENFCRLRVVPASEVNALALADAERDDDEPAVESTTDEKNSSNKAASDDVITAPDGEEMTLVDESGHVVARSNREVIDESARQTLSSAEIEELKRKGAAAGQELIAKLLLSHTAIDQKTAYSLAKYKLLKTRKYIRRFTVLPLDVALLGQWLLEDRDSSKILEMRPEMVGLIGCWADVHFAAPPVDGQQQPVGGRWLVIDDAGGFLVAAMAERMGLLYPREDQTTDEAHATDPETGAPEEVHPGSPKNSKKRPRKDDFEVQYAPNNTITLIHANSQPNTALLKYFDFDSTDVDPPYPYHPLFTNLLPISWLQVIAPEEDVAYAEEAPEAAPEAMASWKANRRGHYHRKRRRWARTRHVVEQTRAGSFGGLACASTMDPVSIVRHTLPLLAGGAPIAIYSPTVEPLTRLADCFSVGRRGAWVSDPPDEARDKTLAELERWEGTDEFPLNPTLLLGASVQTSRARRWQVLEGRTHPVMTSRGGAEGYIFTGYKALPVEGRISARGRFAKKSRS